MYCVVLYYINECIILQPFRYHLLEWPSVSWTWVFSVTYAWSLVHTGATCLLLFMFLNFFFGCWLASLIYIGGGAIDVFSKLCACLLCMSWFVIFLLQSLWSWNNWKGIQPHNVALVQLLDFYAVRFGSVCLIIIIIIQEKINVALSPKWTSRTRLKTF